MRRVLYINSQEENRTSGNNEDFVITKNIEEWDRAPKSVKLISASIPYTWNNITAVNNTLEVDLGSGFTTLVINPGNYTGSELANILQTELQVLDPNFAVSFDDQLLQYNITNTNNFTLQFSLTGSLATVLGFNPNSSYGPTNNLTSINNAVLLQDYDLFICSDIVNGSDNGIIPWKENNTFTLGSQNQILSRVPVCGEFGTIQRYNAHPELPFFTIKQSRFARNRGEQSSIRFFLKFPSDLNVDLNGYHWSAVLLLDF